MDVEEYRQQGIKEIVAKYGVPGVGDDYDPNDHRNVARPTNYAETLMHVMKGCLGTGILAMPLAFKYAGTTVGFVSSFFITAICTYGIQIFFRSQYTVCKTLKTSYMPYNMIMKAALLSGPVIFTKLSIILPCTVVIFLIIYQIGVCACYIIFMADNIKDVYEVNKEGSKTATELYMLMLYIPLLLISSVPNLKAMSIFSLISNILTFAASVVMISVMVRDLPDLSTRRQTGKLVDFPLSFGIVLFALSAMGVLMAVERDMKKPQQMICWWGTLNMSMIFIACLYTFIGLFGFWKYGENVKDSITLNLNENYRAEGSTVQVLYVLAIYVTYGLNAMVPIEMIWSRLDERLTDWKCHPYGLILTRLFIVTISMICATCIPLFGDVISLLGAFGMSCLELIFPAIIHISANWPNNLGRGKWIMIVDVIVFLIGIWGMVAGTYSSILSIAKHLKEIRG